MCNAKSLDCLWKCLQAAAAARRVAQAAAALAAGAAAAQAAGVAAAQAVARGPKLRQRRFLALKSMSRYVRSRRAPVTLLHALARSCTLLHALARCCTLPPIALHACRAKRLSPSAKCLTRRSVRGWTMQRSRSAISSAASILWQSAASSARALRKTDCQRECRSAVSCCRSAVSCCRSTDSR